MAKYLVCVDPSIKALGFAVFKKTDAFWATWKLVTSTGIKLKNKDRGNPLSWVDRVDEMTSMVMDLLLDATSGIENAADAMLLIELPDYRTDAASNTGSIEKLVAFVFTLRAMASSFCKVTLVPVRKWKGNTPKSITQARVAKHWNWSGRDHNEADAVGIGDWAIRKAKLV
jgi:hypothetical protein